MAKNWTNAFLKGPGLFFVTGLLVAIFVSVILSKNLREGEIMAAANEKPKYQTTMNHNLVGKSDQELKEMLTPLQYKVTQEEGTERPFANEYWDNKKEGIYVDVISGKPLFASIHKYDSKTGWPSFYKTLNDDEVVEVRDSSFGMVRTEVRSKTGNDHLGHLFNDGPEPTGLRYCINSAALRFIPLEDLEKEGYGAYLKLFKDR